MEHMEVAQENEKFPMKEKGNTLSADEEFTLEDADSNKTKANNSLLDSSIINDGSFTPQGLINNSPWKINQLAWARMSIYPFWPCMTTYDPSSLMTFQKVQIIGKSNTLMVHVHFFNDNSRHSWIPAHHVIPFNGIEDFRKRASLITDEIRKKEPKFAAALTVKPHIFKTWQKAVAEAMDVLYELDTTPLENFKPQLKDLTNSISKSKSVTKKRKRKTEESDRSTKKVKQLKPPWSNLAEIDSEVNTTTNENSTEIGNNLNLETPPVSPPNEDEDLRTATFQKQKRITKMINKLQPPDFEVYYERNFFTIKELHSDTTDEQVREYLYDVWEHMAPEEKLKYRATYKIVNDS